MTSLLEFETLSHDKSTYEPLLQFASAAFLASIAPWRAV
jgi:hypothetical protein